MMGASYKTKKDLKVESFGGDCLGNPTGYRVVERGPYGYSKVLAQFVANIYDVGSHTRARQDAEEFACITSSKAAQE